ncbi:MAG: DNA topoisomerase I [Candidatus Bathyarchaeota archaeon]|nr:DNA topoisomerase I [Candidatus Bathyarchaeota archaeon]
MPERILVITEKPSSARRIARALDDQGKPSSLKNGSVQYHVSRRGEDELIIVSALGHLYTIIQKGKGWNYPVYDIEWAPTYQAGKSNPRTRAHINAIKDLSQGATGYVSACDYDIEGSLIAYTILLYAVGDHSLAKSRRMLYSTLTREDLNKSWENMLPALDYPVIAAGKARHEMDWLFGINLSRALSLSVRKASGDFKTLSIGRVQGPTLRFVKEREEEINTFVPIPYWKINAETKIEDKKYPLEYEKQRLEREVHAKDVATACRGKEGTIKAIRSETETTPSPPPFNLGDLQREAYRVFKMNPSATLASAEKLYLSAHISYPRTSSQKLPSSIDLREILRKLAKNPSYAKQAEVLLMKKRLIPRQGKKDDVAHPAIHPTGSRPRRLGDNEKNVYDLVVKRFLACLSEPAIHEKIQGDIDVNGHLFYLNGSKTLESGWMDSYQPYVKDKEVLLPELKVGMTLPITKLSSRRNYSSPPPRFNQSTLLRLMENQNIGTKATRTNIIDTLYRRHYIEGNIVRITDLGFSIIETLERYSPDIISVEMTRELEQNLEDIQSGNLHADTVIENTVKTLDPILKRFKENAEKIGSEISLTLKDMFYKENYLGKCPSCGEGDIMIQRNRKTGKNFASCTNTKNGSCNQTYSLPQKKKVYSTGQRCVTCSAPVIKMYYGRKPWSLCLNAACPTKKGEHK